VIDVHCKGRLRDGTRCQEIYHADESNVGRSIRCPKCGEINWIARSAPVQSTYPLGARPVPITSAEGRPTRQVSRSTSGHSLRMKAAILAGVVLGVIGIAVAVDKLWPDSSKKSGAESSPTVKQSVAPFPSSQPQDIQLPVVEPISPISNPWRQGGNLAPTEPSHKDLAFPTTNGEPWQIPISPCAQGQQVERPQTGTRIEADQGTSGSSKLTISNGTQRDAVVRLLQKASGRTARFVYIEAGKKYTLGNINSGTYLLRFISGYDWVSACRDFLREPDYSEFEDSLSFQSVMPTDGQDGYTTKYEVSLNEVPLGNARKRNIDRKRFFEGDQYVAISP
jgi:hypothetical protein